MSRRVPAKALRLLFGGALSGTLSLPACLLEEVEITGPDDLVVAEVLVQLRDDPPSTFYPRVYALLHRATPDARGSREVGVDAATIRTPRGTIALAGRPLIECATELTDRSGTCLRASPADEERIRPEDPLAVEIRLSDGGRLYGTAVVPSEFSLRGTPGARSCVLGASIRLGLAWTRSLGAWGYFSEGAIQDLGQLRPDDWLPGSSLRLQGVSAGDADTTIVFPTEFGLDQRFQDDPALLVQLQDGLPAGAFAQISIAAAERNYANWHRRGAFNPSGRVRLPSLRGDGTGYFGAVVVRTLTVWSPPRPGRDPDQEAPCP